MKTLIFHGSPRKSGDTAAMINALSPYLPGEVSTVRAYDGGISPCIDCRACMAIPGCAVFDGMGEIYRQIEESDVIVIASPVYFSTLSGPLLSLLSRLQCYYCARRFLHTELIAKPKTGIILLSGGGDGKPEKAAETARSLLRLMRAEKIYPAVVAGRTDILPARDDEAALEKIRELGGKISLSLKNTEE